jgi:hypothetical protein
MASANRFCSSQLGLYFMDPVEAQKYFTPEECESLPEIW